VTTADGDKRANQLNKLSHPLSIHVGDDELCIYNIPMQNHRLLE